MVSQAKRIANQSNAAKSTGPRSDEGKRRSSQNRLRHGFFSAAVVLEGEDRAAYDALLAELVDEHRPQTPTQMLCVQRVADCTWKLWRVEASAAEAHARRAVFVRYEAAQWREDAEHALRATVERRWEPLWEADPEQVRRLRERSASLVAGASAGATLAASMAHTVQQAAINPGEFDRLLRYEQRLQNMLHRALNELRKLRQEQSATDDLPPSPYANGAQEHSVECDNITSNQTGETGAAPLTVVRNEPTAPASPAGSPPLIPSPDIPQPASRRTTVRNEPTVGVPTPRRASPS